MFKLFKPKQSEQHMGGICLYTYAKKTFLNHEGGNLEFLLWLRTEVTFIDYIQNYS